MPLWLLKVLPWAKNRLINFIVYAIIGLFVWGAYSKIFLKETNRTVISSGGKQINVYDVPKVSLFNFGCSNFKVDAYWQKARLQK